MSDRILVGVDGSDCALRGVEVGLELAAARGALVDVVHVARPDGEGDHASAVLDEVADVAAGVDVTVELHALGGNPAAVLVAEAGRRAADLVVVGRRGTGGLADRLLGSVAHRVLRQSDRPVLTVPDSEEDFRVGDVLVTTDGSDAAERAAPDAARLAGAHGATVHALTAVDLETAAGPFSAGGLTDAEVAHYEQRGQEAVDRLADLMRETDPALPVRTAVVRGRPHAAILEYVADHDVDVVVMSSRGESSFAGQLLGSVADRVLRVADVPVLVVVSRSDRG
jgi:nucleotide-binding universal stress UspA family protein